MIRAIIFDVDGVLVDSKNANVAFYQSILRAAGYPEPSREAVLGCFHLPLVQSLEELTGSQDKEEIQRIYNMAEDPSLRNSALFEFPEQLEKVLEKLHRKYKLAIVTSRIKVGMDDIFQAKEIKHLFDVVVTFEDYKSPKPHPEPLLVALKRLGLRADEAMYIGDSPTDIEAARAAHMKSIFLAATMHNEATMSVAAFDELLQAIDGIA